MDSVPINDLRYLYLEMKDRAMSESEALQVDQTELLISTLESMIKHGELINIQLRGEVRTSKSTIGCKLLMIILSLLEKANKTEDQLPLIRERIFSDQTEFLRFINSDIYTSCILIDEFNRMAKTGLNATTEGELYDYYSDVFAAKYIHRISCAPDVIIDKNATIILDVMGKDEKRGLSRCKLIYRDIVDKNMLTLGYVDIYVGDIVKNWIREVRPLFTKGDRTDEEIKKIEDWRKKDWYIGYQVKKYKRMELLEKHGIRDIREPEYSMIILETLMELQDLAKIKKVPFEIIHTVADEVRRRHKRIYSTLALQEIAVKTKAIISIYTEIQNLSKAEKKAKNPEERQVIKKTLKQMKEMLENRIKEQEELRTIYGQYVKIN